MPTLPSAANSLLPSTASPWLAPIRFGVLLFPEQAKSWALILAILGVVNILYGAILAMRQTDFKLILAYSSISHMGIVLLGIAAFNKIGLEGAIFGMASPGIRHGRQQPS